MSAAGLPADVDADQIKSVSYYFHSEQNVSSKEKVSSFLRKMFENEQIL